MGVSSMFYKDERLSLFIDGSNLYACARTLGFDSMNFPNNQYHIAFLALGSNTPLSNLSSAEIVSAALDAILSNGITITLKSNWWQSPAFPTGSGADYINGVVAICTLFSPYELGASTNARFCIRG
jgi:hypothetical protein